MAGKPSGRPTIEDRAHRIYKELLKENPDLANARQIEKAEAVAPLLALEADWAKVDAAAVRRTKTYLARRQTDLEITVEQEPDTSPVIGRKELWESAKTLNSRVLAKAQTKGKATLRVDSQKPFGILFSSDEHLDDTGTDLQWLENMARLVSDTDGLYAGLHGDLRNNFIIPQLLSTILKSRYTPASQMEFVDIFVEMFGGKVLYLVAGNHDNWEAGKTGIDTLAKLASDGGIIYDTDQLVITLKCEAVDYKIGVRHKGRFNSSYNATHGPKQWLRMGLVPSDTDLVIGGHYHNPALERFLWNDRWRVAIQTGSAKISDDYPVKIGVAPGGPMAPLVIFRPDRRRMIPFENHHEGAEYLTYLRESA